MFQDAEVVRNNPTPHEQMGIPSFARLSPEQYNINLKSLPTTMYSRITLASANWIQGE